MKVKKFCPCRSTLISVNIKDQKPCKACGYGIVAAKKGDKYIDKANTSWSVVDVISEDCQYPSAWVIWVSECGGYKRCYQNQWKGGFTDD